MVLLEGAREHPDLLRSVVDFVLCESDSALDEKSPQRRELPGGEVNCVVVVLALAEGTDPNVEAFGVADTASEEVNPISLWTAFEKAHAGRNFQDCHQHFYVLEGSCHASLRFLLRSGHRGTQRPGGLLACPREIMNGRAWTSPSISGPPLNFMRGAASTVGSIVSRRGEKKKASMQRDEVTSLDVPRRPSISMFQNGELGRAVPLYTAIPPPFPGRVGGTAPGAASVL